MNFAIPDLYDFLRGPGFVISILIFSSGVLYRSLQLIHATRKIKRYNPLPENFVHDMPVSHQGGLLLKIILIKTKMKNTVFGTHPGMSLISLLFHLLLFITPLFLTAHNIIAEFTFGISLPSIPEHVTDIFTIILIAIGGFFLVRRIMVPRVRIISTVRDYFILLIVMAPFVSAFLAYHHFFNYRIVIYIHMIIGEIAIMLIPFTSLIHMPFIIFSRFFIDSEFSLTPGNRSW